MVKPSGPRRSAPEVELCIPVIDEESTKGRRISMMITIHLLMDAPKSTLGPIGRLGDDLHDARQAMASNMLGYIRNHWEDGYCIKEQVAQAVKTNHNSPERTGGVDDNTPGAGEVAGQDVSLDAGSSDSGGGLGSGGGGGSAPSSLASPTVGAENPVAIVLRSCAERTVALHTGEIIDKIERPTGRTWHLRDFHRDLTV